MAGAVSSISSDSVQHVKKGGEGYCFIQWLSINTMIFLFLLHTFLLRPLFPVLKHHHQFQPVKSHTSVCKNRLTPATRTTVSGKHGAS